MRRTSFLFLTLIFLIASCAPYTSVPMVALMGIDSVGKRKRLEDYAKDGDVYSMFDLAESYRSHPYEGPTDHVKAAEWYCKAARGGYSKAQFEVGMLYEGRSKLDVEMEHDPARSYMWYTLAARRVHQGAIDAIERLRKELSDKEKARGEMLLTEWKQVPCGPLEAEKPMPKFKKKPAAKKKKTVPKKESVSKPTEKQG